MNSRNPDLIKRSAYPIYAGKCPCQDQIIRYTLEYERKHKR
jgi:hypothetical protein